MAEGFHVTYDAKVMGTGDPTKAAQTLAGAKHTGTVTNKVTLWTGVAATTTATGWTTVKVESNSKKDESLSVHPSVST